MSPVLLQEQAQLTLCEAALSYARAEFKVFPLAPRSKLPLIPQALGGRGFKDATTDEVTILQWWKANPNANIGIACVEGLVVIDQDRHHADQDGVKAWQAILSEHEPHETLVQVTGSNGLHAVYWDTRHRHTGSKKGTIIDGVPGIDLKDQGYIVAAPSVHPDTGNVYEWLNPGTPIADLPEWFYVESPKSVAIPRQPATYRPRIIREPTELEVQAAMLMADIYPLALNGEATLRLIHDGDPAEPDQSNIISRICRGAAQVRFDPDRLFEMLTCEANIGGEGLRRRIKDFGEDFARRWLDRIVLWAHWCRAQILADIAAMRTEAEEYDWPKVITFTGRNGTSQGVKGSTAKRVLMAALDVAQRRVCLDPMIGVETQLPALTGIKSHHTTRKAVQALEWLGWWSPSVPDIKGEATNAYQYTFDPDPEARLHPPLKVKVFFWSVYHHNAGI